MNPSEDDLNCLLKTWTVPRSPDSLEGRLRRAYGDRARSRTTPGLLEVSSVQWEAAPGRQRKCGRGVWSRWIAGFLPFAGKFAGVIAVAVVLLAVITRAFPQSLGLFVPPGAIIIDSEFLDYGDDGSSTVSEYRTSVFSTPAWVTDTSSVSHIYGETTLSSSFPGDPLRTTAVELLNPVKVILDPVMHRMFDPLFYKPGRTSYLRAVGRYAAARIRNNCTPTNYGGTPMTVIGRETLLNYTTTVSQSEGRDARFTQWFALGLDCLPLRSTTEKALPDGTFQLASERRVLKVTTNSSRTAAKEPSR
jgi:hypothetical protein